MIKPSVKVKELVDNFEFEILHGNSESFKREITVADTNRPGLELAGFFGYSQKKRIVVFGDKEIEYIKTMSEASQKESFDFLTDGDTPVIIISKEHDCPELLDKVAAEKKFPVLRSNVATSRLIINIVSFLDEKLARMDSLHGVLLNIYGKGVLIRGESGMGKSEVALDLVRRGHQLISDDLVDCFHVHNKIIGHPPEMLRDFIELRGIGIINIRKLYGPNSTLPKTEVDFVIELTPWDSSVEYDRVGIEEPKYEDILDVKIPKIILPMRSGRSIATLIESAVTNIVLKEDGYDSSKAFEQRVLSFIGNNKGEN